MVRVDERIAARRADVRDEQRRRRLRRTLVVVAVAILALVLVLVERSALVALEEVVVSGTDRLDDEVVRDAAGLRLGTSTLRLDVRGAAERVEALPLVAQATVRRVDPLTVEVAVTERVPVLRAIGGGEQRLIDRDGVVLADGEDDPAPVLEVIVASPPPEPGVALDEDPTLANAHAVWAGLSGPLRSTVDRFEAHGPQELSVHLDGGIEVRFGRADRLDEKVRALGAVLEDVGDDPDVGVIDVRAPSTPVVIGR